MSQTTRECYLRQQLFNQDYYVYCKAYFHRQARGKSNHI